ncbi:MAG TPA: hypothetical protein VNG13_09635 [Mycobacteriales bacterium]|nr:hypothetical protein [Mycobacteriales bacterium]
MSRLRAGRLAALQLLVGALAVGCGGQSSFPCCRAGTQDVVTASVATSGPATTVQLKVNQILEVPVIDLKETRTSPGGILQPINPGPGVADFRAVQAGQTTVTILGCVPGGSCPPGGTPIGTLVAVVTG